MKENAKDFLLNLLVSMLIGLLVGVFLIIAPNIRNRDIENLILCAIMGGSIGTLSRFAFIYVLDIKRKDAKLAFIAVFIIIGVISALPTLYDYIFRNDNFSMVRLTEILIAAEIFGMSVCYYSYKRGIELNAKLLNKKLELKKRQ